MGPTWHLQGGDDGTQRFKVTRTPRAFVNRLAIESRGKQQTSKRSSESLVTGNTDTMTGPLWRCLPYPFSHDCDTSAMQGVLMCVSLPMGAKLTLKIATSDWRFSRFPFLATPA